MGSEALANTRIFFKDKQNELKGPYTERQVQEWYRKGWFDGSFQFCFMKETDRPRKVTEFFTLDTLISLNGIGCPFTKHRIEAKDEEIEEKLTRLEKDLADLSKKCDEVKKMESRLEQIEMGMNELSMQQLNIGSIPAAAATESAAVKDAVMEKDREKDADSSGEKNNQGKKEETKDAPKTVMEQRDKKRQEELKKFNEWTDYFSDFYMVFVDTMQILTDESIVKLKSCFAQGMSIGRLIIEREEARLMCVHKIIEKIKMRSMNLMLIDCKLCGYPHFNYKQCFIHSIDPDHIEKEKSLILSIPCIGSMVAMSDQIMGNYPSLWKAEEEVFATEIAKKYAAVPLDEKCLRPSKSFSEKFENDYVEEIVCGPNLRNPTNSYDDFTKLHDHIGSNLTLCRVCNVVTGTRDEYYRHLLLTTHTKKCADSPPIVHYQTALVNLLKKDLVY